MKVETVQEELALERSGPERYLSCFYLFRKLIESMDSKVDTYKKAKNWFPNSLGDNFKKHVPGIANQLEEGQAPTLAASIVKDLGLPIRAGFTWISARSL